MKIAYDLDDTICTSISRSDAIDEVSTCIVKDKVKRDIIELKKLGHEVIIFTHRRIDLKMVTEAWLRKNNILYDKLIFGKPSYDLLIDNKAYPPYNFLTAKVIEGMAEKIKRWNFEKGGPKNREEK